MINFIGLGFLLAVIFITGTLAYFAWDQLALVFNWPRPSWGAGLGAVYIMILFHFLNTNRIAIGGINADSNGGGAESAPKGRNRRRAEVRKDPPIDFTPVG